MHFTIHRRDGKTGESLRLGIAQTAEMVMKRDPELNVGPARFSRFSRVTPVPFSHACLHAVTWVRLDLGTIFPRSPKGKVLGGIANKHRCLDTPQKLCPASAFPESPT